MEYYAILLTHLLSLSQYGGMKVDDGHSYSSSILNRKCVTIKPPMDCGESNVTDRAKHTGRAANAYHVSTRRGGQP